ncbi:MAG: NADH-quinone oxidoreductase subunit L [Prevotella sp.]|jgi:NADH-quinone oxidoreductase subunit L
MEYSYAFLILLLPFVSFLVLGLLGMKMKPRVAGLIGTALIGTVFALCLYTAYEYFFVIGRDAATGLYPTVTVFNFTWLDFGKAPLFGTELLFKIGFRLSPISVMMLIVITTVSFMVHIYSFGYMAERDENYKAIGYEKGFQRFYAFLGLFTMSMLGLVVATNIFQMYLFWELVGVCSYLLIGFYYPKHAAVHASKKAFIVTRFADLFFLIGILFYSFYVGTFSYDLNATQDIDLSGHLAGAAFILPAALFLMFIGGAGKSAMFPLHIWLPDAMEGPTPVSALIHAATMVVAGVYQVASLLPIWVKYAPDQLHWVAWIAAFTAFYAAAVACCQRDIKRGLAFSTISQIAYMLVALGVCTGLDSETGLGYTASMFHLFTHAMFKALLFLCSGAIIVIIGSNFKEYMGGLHKYMPITNICFLIGCLAISGIPPFAGFFSKDTIIDACALMPGWQGVALKWIMTVVAGMTAFYMFRLYYVIFWGQSYYELDPEHRKKPAEVPFVMWGPLVFLAAISCVAGFIPFGHFVSANGLSFDIHINWTIAGTSIFAALIGIGLATYMYMPKNNPLPDKLAKAMPRLHRAALNRFYIDDAWQFFTHKIVFGCFSIPIAWFDRHVIDGMFNFAAWGTQEAGQSIRPWQSGDVRQYAVWFLTGAVALVLILLCV